MNFKAVIFDLDGTLLDSLTDLANTLNSVLESNGLPTHTRETVRYLVGYGMDELVRTSLPQELRKQGELLEKLKKEMQENYAKTWMNTTIPYPGIAELLDWIDTIPIKKGVLSNKPDRFTKLCVETLLGSWKFDSVSGHHPGISHKPAPEGALHMSDEMAVAPPEILYAGDSEVDMQTAIAAGMYPLGVLWGFRTEKELLESGAKKLVETPQEIIELLSDG
ncbi:MAG: HAD family hydrolase [Chlorobium sp.]|nr:HAD family hydrolase [Chlorobium sp.]MCW8819117.1 HAD family hydrolase [Ignavibacteriaceae bacterium]